MSLVISLSDFNILNLFLICSSETQQGIFDAVLKGHIDFDSDPWPVISDSAKDLIRKMLCSDPKERLTAHQVLCECFLLYWFELYAFFLSFGKSSLFWYVWNLYVWSLPYHCDGVQFSIRPTWKPNIPSPLANEDSPCPRIISFFF